MVKRLFDIVIALILLVIFTPFLIIFGFLIWKQDFYSPFYIAPRVGKNEIIFKMINKRASICSGV